MQRMSQAPLAAQIGPETAPLGHFVAFGVLWPPSSIGTSTALMLQTPTNRHKPPQTATQTATKPPQNRHKPPRGPRNFQFGGPPRAPKFLTFPAWGSNWGPPKAQIEETGAITGPKKKQNRPPKLRPQTATQTATKPPQKHRKPTKAPQTATNSHNNANRRPKDPERSLRRSLHLHSG